jgi:hypothetical protein
VHRGVRAIAPNGTASSFFGDLVISAGTGIALSTGGASTAGSIAIHNVGPTLKMWANMHDVSSFATRFRQNEFNVAPMAFAPFPGVMTAKSVSLWLSHAAGQESASSYNWSWQVGIYTLANSTQLSLLYSASTALSSTTSNSQSNNFVGLRALTFDGTQFAGGGLTFSQTHYWIGIVSRTSNISAAQSLLGSRILGTAYSGVIGQTNTSQRPLPGYGIYTSTFTTAVPNSIGFSQLSFANTSANSFMAPSIAFAASDIGT